MEPIAVKFYNELYTESNINIDTAKELINKMPKIDYQQTKHITRPIECKEITRAINQLKIKKAPGEDGLTAEFYKQWPSQTSKILIEVFDEFKRKGEILMSFSKGIVVLLAKKGDPKSLGN